MIRRPPRSTPLYSSAASDVYKRQSYYSESAAQHHALFLCTRDDAGDDIGCVLRRYTCPLCHVAFFSSAGLQSHTVSMHGSLHSASTEISVSTPSKLDSLTNNFCESDIFPQQSGTGQASAQIHSPFALSSAAGSSPASAEETSLPHKVSPVSYTHLTLPTNREV